MLTPDNTKERQAESFWEETENDPFGCSIFVLVEKFGGEIATPLLLRSLDQNTNLFVRINIATYTAWLCWDENDTNGCLSAVAVKALTDPNEEVRNAAWQSIESLKEKIKK